MNDIFFINKTAIPVDKEKTVLQSARENGIYIPSLCHHQRTGQAGVCRICVIEVEGMQNLQTACSLLPFPGMEVTTESNRIMEARKLIVNLLLSNGKHNCISCEMNGDCELQNAAYRLGIEAPAFIAEELSAKDDSAVFIRRDQDKCIKCGRCVEGCNNLVVNEVLDFGYRGDLTKVICDDDKPMGESSCVQCGECVQLCPVGALIEKKGAGMGRVWERKKVRTTCPYCGVGCQLELHVKGDRIIRVTGSEGAEPNRGHLCVKGRYGYDFIYSDDRLKTPLIREGESFREAGWDEALNLVASKFRQIIDESGPDALAGVSCARSTNEDSYNMQKFFRGVLGTNNIDHCART